MGDVFGLVELGLLPRAELTPVGSLSLLGYQQVPNFADLSLSGVSFGLEALRPLSYLFELLSDLESLQSLLL